MLTWGYLRHVATAHLLKAASQLRTRADAAEKRPGGGYDTAVLVHAYREFATVLEAVAAAAEADGADRDPLALESLGRAVREWLRVACAPSAN